MSILIGIDIGHGEDTWRTGGGKGVKVNGVVYEEHNFNSDIAVIIDRRLKDHGFRTYMAQKPRTKNVDLTTRTNLYKSQKVNMILSIHANAVANTTAKGAGAFYWHNNTGGKKLAELYVKHFFSTVEGVGKYSSGAIASVPNTWSDFHMTRVPNLYGIPSILTENGFMTNPNDFEYIFGKNKDKYIEQVAEAHVKIVCEYYNIKYYAPIKEDAVVTPSKEVKALEKFEPSNIYIKQYVIEALKKLEAPRTDGKQPLSSDWRDKFVKGEMTTSDAIGLLYTAILRDLI